MPELELTSDAEWQLLEFGERYVERGHIEAYEKLKRNVAFAANPNNLSRHRFYSAPRPAPQLAILGFRWMLHNGYWFAYNSATPPAIIAIIHGSANIVGQAAHLFPPADKV